MTGFARRLNTAVRADLRKALGYARNPPVYILAVFALGIITSMAIAVYVSTTASDRALREVVKAEEQRRADEQRQAAENRIASCRFVVTIAQAYKENPPEEPSATYETIAQAWADLAKFCE